MLNSIEIIDARGLVNRDQVRWEIIELGIITPRLCPLVAPISSTEVLIIGGRYGRNTYGDGYVFNLNDRSVSHCFDSGF